MPPKISLTTAMSLFTKPEAALPEACTNPIMKKLTDKTDSLWISEMRLRVIAANGFIFTTSGLWWPRLYPYSKNIERFNRYKWFAGILASQRRAPASVLNVFAFGIRHCGERAVLVGKHAAHQGFVIAEVDFCILRPHILLLLS